MKRVALSVTVYDPQERLLAYIDQVLPELRSYYSDLAAACTESTSDKTVVALKALGFATCSTTDGQVGQTRRDSLKLLLAKKQWQWVHYADLDRLIHWRRF